MFGVFQESPMVGGSGGVRVASSNWKYMKRKKRLQHETLYRTGRRKAKNWECAPIIYIFFFLVPISTQSFWQLCSTHVNPCWHISKSKVVQTIASNRNFPSMLLDPLYCSGDMKFWCCQATTAHIFCRMSVCLIDSSSRLILPKSGCWQRDTPWKIFFATTLSFSHASFWGRTPRAWSVLQYVTKIASKPKPD